MNLRVRIIALVIVVINCYPSVAQTLYVPGGAGGIGTSSTAGKVGIGISAPSFELDISSALPYLRLHSSVYTNNPAAITKKGGIIFNHQSADKTAAISGAVPPGYHVPGILFSTKTAWNSPGSGSQDWYDRMFIHPDGNVGIGTVDPKNRLHVIGAIQLDGTTGLPANAEGANNTNYATNYNFKLSNNNNGLYVALSNVHNERKAFIQSGHRDSDYAYGMGSITLNPFGGNVGIGTGTTSPTSKLTVAGDIHSREVKVTIGAGSDFVFLDNYQLKTLEEVENFIKTNKHLPDIEPAKQMEEEGIDLGKMDMKLLQKIEELTLYLIEFQRVMNEIKDDNQKLKERIAELEKNKPK